VIAPRGLTGRVEYNAADVSSWLCG